MVAGSTRVDVGKRRVFTVEEKKRIVGEYRAAIAAGEVGGDVLRREGVYQSVVHRWGVQIDNGTLGTRQRGRAGTDQAKVRVRELEAQLANANTKIAALEELVSTQGKCLALHAEIAGSATPASMMR